jgi:hypothetical protein
MSTGSIWAVPVLAAALAHAPTPRVAVVDADVEGEAEAQVQEAVTAGFVGGLEAAGIEVVGAGEACGDADCVRAVAERNAASHVARARVTVVGTDYGFVLELVDARSGEVAVRMDGTCEICTHEEAGEAVFEHAKKFQLEVTAAAVVSLVVESSPSGANLHIDGVAAGTTPYRAEVEPGEYEVSATLRGYEPVRQQILAEGDSAEVRLELQRSRYRPGPPGVAGWAVGAAGFATLIGGVVLIAINNREVRGSCSGENVDAEGNCAFRHDTLAGGVTMTVLGAAGMGAGAGLVIWDHKRTGSGVTAGLGIDGIRLQGRF